MLNKLVDLFTEAKNLFNAAPLFAQVLVGLVLFVVALGLVRLVFAHLLVLVLLAALVAVYLFVVRPFFDK